VDKIRAEQRETTTRKTGTSRASRSGTEIACGIVVVDGAASKFSRADELAQQLLACPAELIGHPVAQHADASVAAAPASPHPKANWKARAKASRIPAIFRIAGKSLATAALPAQ
jgi:hypothetical protein